MKYSDSACCKFGKTSSSTAPQKKPTLHKILDPDLDIEADFENATDTREDYSVRVDLDRIEFMINGILDQSNL